MAVAPRPGFSRQLASEFVGTTGLLIAVVGSGIAVSRAAESDAIALLIHAIVVGFALIALIAALAPWSNHFNPAVTLALWRSGRVEARRVAPLMGAQIAGALVGVLLANLMFGETWLAIGDKPRAGFGLWLGEAIATFGLVLVVLATAGRRAEVVAWVVGLFIAAAIWFTSSTSFANPAVTLGRVVTDTWSGIRAADVPAFIAAQLAGAWAATAWVSWMGKPTSLDS